MVWASRNVRLVMRPYPIPLVYPVGLPPFPTRIPDPFAWEIPSRGREVDVGTIVTETPLSNDSDSDSVSGYASDLENENNTKMTQTPVLKNVKRVYWHPMPFLGYHQDKL